GCPQGRHDHPAGGAERPDGPVHRRPRLRPGDGPHRDGGHRGRAADQRKGAHRLPGRLTPLAPGPAVRLPGSGPHLKPLYHIPKPLPLPDGGEAGAFLLQKSQWAGVKSEGATQPPWSRTWRMICMTPWSQWGGARKATRARRSWLPLAIRKPYLAVQSISASL